MNELISIIVPMYNCETLINNCIESIKAQTHSNLEILLVDNGSTDATFDVARSAAEQDSRIKVYRSEKKGVSEARNLGLKKAMGNYIGFVDADDYIAADMYEYLLNLLKENDADISSCNIFYINRNGQKLFADDSEKKILNGFAAIKECFLNNAVFVSVWNKLYKREVVNDITFPPVGMSEDLKFLYDICKKDVSMVCGFKAKYYYDKSNGKPSFEQRDLDSLKVFREIINEERSLKDENRIKFFEERYIKHLYSLFIKVRLYPHRANPEEIIKIAKREYFRLFLVKDISLKFKLFVTICLINTALARTVNKYIVRT
ncbi:glycosyltransferase family 2 protein [Candidatus Proelusimicrobium volucris]|uniref:glycosyltransferase family 2 protein n=1 Tax=Candidatus Proelusimicrobium volucris TaxID=3416225 RepID=UPI003D0E545C